jgi:hypothetical protein
MGPYFTKVLDQDGNNIEAVFHGRGAESDATEE